MQYWKVKSKPLPGTSYAELKKQAVELFAALKRKTKRDIYLRSRYFKKSKVFFDHYWDHLLEKRFPDRVRRLKLLPCASELIINSVLTPDEKTNSQKKSEILYRFFGKTAVGQKFIVQIKKSTGKKKLQFMSVFPEK